MILKEFNMHISLRDHFGLIPSIPITKSVTDSLALTEPDYDDDDVMHDIINNTNSPARMLLITDVKGNYY